MCGDDRQCTARRHTTLGRRPVGDEGVGYEPGNDGPSVAGDQFGRFCAEVSGVKATRQPADSAILDCPRHRGGGRNAGQLNAQPPLGRRRRPNTCRRRFGPPTCRVTLVSRRPLRIIKPLVRVLMTVSRPVSGILSPGSFPLRLGGHPSMRSTWGDWTGRPSHDLTLLRVGFAKPPESPRALVRSYRTVSP